MGELIVLKLGGSVITKKSENKMEVDLENLQRLCRDIAEIQKKIKCNFVVVHGAGPFGHVLAEKYRLTEGMKGKESVKGMCETHASMEKLNAIVVEELNKAGLNAMAFQPSTGVMKNRRLISFPIESLKDLIALGITPVGYGDVLVDLETGLNILSGDHLVPYLAVKLKASRIVIATDVSGIFDGDPKRDKNAKLVKEITKENFGKIEVSGSRGVDVTGGMKRKVLELLEVASHGVTSQVVSGIKPGELKSALLGREVGTIIH
ncbi:MAG: isopentenyl phosphate kinase family protein [Candidatus Altiarchaeales archaeon]|nr:isopentenyl phosphate kinase family protein [Candidatus Altiarchaeales archaeon]